MAVPSWYYLLTKCTQFKKNNSENFSAVECYVSHHLHDFLGIAVKKLTSK